MRSRLLKDRRDDVQLATKFSLVGNPADGYTDIRGDAAYVRQAVDASLKRLGTDVIDVCYMHRRDLRVPIVETVEAMAGLVQQGKIKHLGLSEVTAQELAEANSVHPIAAVQSEWSIWSRDVERNVGCPRAVNNQALNKLKPMDTLIHDLRNITIRRISVSEMDNNVYLLTAKESGAQLLIDAADDLPAIQGLLRDAAADTTATPKLELIATTHQHWDHVRALPALVEATGARTAAGTDDAPELPVKVDVLLDHGDVGNFDGFDVTAVHLRGHTPGSVALVYRDPDGPAHIFSGDSLFPGGVGNTQKDPDRFSQLINDVCERLFDVYPDDTVVHPGHGKPTTLGAERPHLEEWRARGW